MDVETKTSEGLVPRLGFWKTTRFNLSLHRPLVMGIVNITPDSFSSLSSPELPSDALLKAECLLREGADILDIGGESTRPGAVPLSHEQEWLRIEPVLRELVNWRNPISVDTYPW